MRDERTPRTSAGRLLSIYILNCATYTALFFSVSLPYMLRSKVSELLCTSSAVYIVCLQYLSF